MGKWSIYLEKMPPKQKFVYIQMLTMGELGVVTVHGGKHY